MHRLTDGNKTAHAYRASLRTVFIDGMAPSAPEATGPSRREQPKDRAAAQPSSPCHLRSQAARTCPPSHGGALRALAAARLLKNTLVSAASDLHAQNHQPGTAILASELGVSPFFRQQRFPPESMSRIARFVLTRPPASRQTRVATFSKTQPRRPKTPAFAHAARWWPRTSRGRPHQQERACR